MTKREQRSSHFGVIIASKRAEELIRIRLEAKRMSIMINNVKGGIK